jgi:transposase
MAHRINANIVHGWRKLARQAAEPAAALVAAPAFVPMVIEPPTPAPTTHPCIDIELRRGPLTVRIAWPLSAAAEMRTWMLELLR